MNPDWSKLPEELLHFISTKLEDHCFDVVHARSVCRLWRSTFPFPSYVLRPRKSLPTFQNKGLWTLEKIPLFLFRVKDPVVADSLYYGYFLGGVILDDRKELPSPLQCSVKLEISGFQPELVNMLDFQIFPLGYYYRLFGWEPEKWMGDYRGVVFLPLDKDGKGRDFVVLLSYSKAFLVFTSAEMRWKRLENIPDSSCTNLVTFRGRIYASFVNGDILVFDPYSLQGTPLIPSQPLQSIKYLIPSGNDELYLVENFKPIPEADDDIDVNRFTCRVSRLDQNVDKWVVVSDLGDRLIFIGDFRSGCCSAKDLPDGCDMTGNSIFLTNDGYVTFPYKYGVRTEWAEDELNIWRYSKEKRMMIYNTYSVVALRLEYEPEHPDSET